MFAAGKGKCQEMLSLRIVGAARRERLPHPRQLAQPLDGSRTVAGSTRSAATWLFRVPSFSLTPIVACWVTAG